MTTISSGNFFSANQIRDDWMWTLAAASLVGIIADLLSILGPLSLHCFMIALVLAAISMLVSAAFARALYFCRRCFLLFVATAAVCLMVFSVQHVQNYANGILGSNFQPVGEFQEALFGRLDRVDGYLERAEQSLRDVTERSDETLDVLNRNQEELRKQNQEINQTLLVLTQVLAEKTGVPEAALRAILLKFDEATTESDDVMRLLEQKAEEFKRLKADLAAVQSPSEAVVDAKATASALLDQGDFEGAREVLQRIREVLREQREMITREEGKLLGQIGTTYLLESNYLIAAQTYGEAATLVAFDLDLSVAMSVEQANSLHYIALDKRDIAAGEQALAVLEGVVERLAEVDRPGLLANAQSHRADISLTLFEISRAPERLTAAVEDTTRVQEFFSYLYDNGQSEAVDNSAVFAQFLAVSARVNYAEFKRTLNEDFGFAAAVNYQMAADTYARLGNENMSNAMRYNHLQLINEFSSDSKADYALSREDRALIANYSRPGESEIDRAQHLWNEASNLSSEARLEGDAKKAEMAVALLGEGLELLDPQADLERYYRLSAASEDLQIFIQILSGETANIEDSLQRYGHAVDMLSGSQERGYFLISLSNYGDTLMRVGSWTSDTAKMDSGEAKMLEASEGLGRAGQILLAVEVRSNLAAGQTDRAEYFRDLKAAENAVVNANCALRAIGDEVGENVRARIAKTVAAAAAICVLFPDGMCTPPVNCAAT